MKKNFYKYLSIFLAIALIVSLAYALVPNSKDVTQASSGNPKLKGSPKEEYYMVTFASGIEYWKGCFKGMKAAADLYGVKAIYTGAPQFDVNQQVTVLRQVIAKKPAGILVTCANPDALKAPIDEAIKKGIPVVTFDADSPKSLRYSVLETGNYNAGAMAARYLGKLLGGKGEVGISTVAAQLNHEQRKQGFIDTLKKEFPGIKVVSIVNDENDSTKAARGVAAMLQAHPNIKGIFCTVAPGGVGVATAIKEANKVGKIKIVSFDTDKGTLDLIKQGVIDASIAQGTWNMGFWGMTFLFYLKHGIVNPVDNWKKFGINPLPPYIDTGTMVVTKQNVDAFYKVNVIK
ncbi:substrate-binding domain-containing protein [Caldicellulosiruptor sp. DIB 104C]|uniref:substrate-binding domain-containing protein n=1 Tax=Caldicellulosiruptor sp. DIB 104C TaxID=3019889 RepID=UPI002306DCD6|nr:substrate-binding domain-containing protein [Caldicellulosiruptor sp. DIB 104C]